jgi:chemotaxis protein MotB
MRKKAHKENHERWLISYADFITLLFAFFVVLFASSQADKKKQAQVARAVQSAFSEMAVFEPGSKTLTISQDGAASEESKPIPMFAPPEQTPEELKKAIDKMVSDQVGQGRLSAGSVTTRITPDGLVISLHDAGFFASGSAEVNPASVHILSTIVDALPNRAVRIEGHTDNVPIHTLQFATNWELSTARASAIARFIIERGSFDPAKLSAAGYAEFHPVASNDTEAGRTENRRVDIILLTGQSGAQTASATASGQAPSR